MEHDYWCAMHILLIIILVLFPSPPAIILSLFRVLFNALPANKKNGVVVSSVFFFSSVSVTVFHSKSLLFTRMRRRLNTPSDELHRFQLIHSSTKSCRNQMILDTRLICKISVHKLAYLARRCKNEWKRSNAIRNWTTNNFRV